LAPVSGFIRLTPVQTTPLFLAKAKTPIANLTLAMGAFLFPTFRFGDPL
jgi:hypothetical protein